VNALQNYALKKKIYMHTNDDRFLDTIEFARMNKHLVFSIYDEDHNKNIKETLNYFTGIMKDIVKALRVHQTMD